MSSATYVVIISAENQGRGALRRQSEETLAWQGFSLLAVLHRRNPSTLQLQRLSADSPMSRPTDMQWWFAREPPWPERHMYIEKTAPVHNFDQNYVSYKKMYQYHHTIWGYKLRHPLYKFDIQIWHFIKQFGASIIQIWHIMTINYVYKFEITLYKFDQIYVKSKAKIYNAS